MGRHWEGFGNFVEEGALKDVVDRVWELSQGKKAFEVLEEGYVRGKFILRA
jgi:NADPH:quinone reductase-like Zn-dependent oxidoreductase